MQNILKDNRFEKLGYKLNLTENIIQNNKIELTYYKIINSIKLRLVRTIINFYNDEDAYDAVTLTHVNLSNAGEWFSFEFYSMAIEDFIVKHKILEKTIIDVVEQIAVKE